jgi:hypothetical protein
MKTKTFKKETVNLFGNSMELNSFKIPATFETIEIVMSGSWKCCKCRHENYSEKWVCNSCRHERCNNCKKLMG